MSEDNVPNDYAREIGHLFILPERVTADPDLRILYEILVAGYLEQVSHLTLSIHGKVLIERIVLYYITQRERERSGTGYGGPVQEKSFKQHWLALVQEFNKMVLASDQKKQQKVLESVLNLILTTVESDVKDESLRNKLVSSFTRGFEEAGII